jgi:hypothetical protein
MLSMCINVTVLDISMSHLQRTIPQVRQYQNRDNEEASRESDERSNEEARVVPGQVGSQSAEGTQSTGTNDVRHEGEDEMERVLRKSLEDFEETEEEEVAIAMVESLQLAQSHVSSPLRSHSCNTLPHSHIDKQVG